MDWDRHNPLMFSASVNAEVETGERGSRMQTTSHRIQKGILTFSSLWPGTDACYEINAHLDTVTLRILLLGLYRFKEILYHLIKLSFNAVQCLQAMLSLTCWTAQREIIIRFQWRNLSQAQVRNKSDGISVTGECNRVVQGILKLHYKQKKLQEVNSEMEISMQGVY